MRAGRIGAGKDPVLPGAEAAEDLGLDRLGANPAQRRFHAGQRIRRERRALLDRDAQLVFEIDIIGGDRHEAELLGFLRRNGPFNAAREDRLHLRRLSVVARLEPR